MTPEFSRPERVETIGDRPHEAAITAAPDERAALAQRFGLIAVERLEARLAVRREAEAIAVKGLVSAAVVQACTVTGDPVPAAIDEPVDLRFVEEALLARDEEVELEDSAVDTLGYRDGVIDLGEVAAETMALALDPFPRSADAERVLRRAGVLSEDEAAPAGPLAGLQSLLTPNRDPA